MTESKLIETYLDYSEKLAKLGFEIYCHPNNGFGIVKKGRWHAEVSTVDGIRAFYYGIISDDSRRSEKSKRKS